MLICKRKEKKKKKKKVSGIDDMAADVAQQERSNNKCYISAFRYIQISCNTLDALVSKLLLFSNSKKVQMSP